MGQMRVTQAALFVRDNLDSSRIKLTRNQEGFVLDRDLDYQISIDDPLALKLQQQPQCHCLEELEQLCPSSEALSVIRSLKPSLIIPLTARSLLTGIILLGERISDSFYCEEEQQYLTDIARMASSAIYNAILFEMSTTDMMTRLKFRHYFTTVVSDKISDQADRLHFSVIMLDIDHFKRINDTYGHSAGDDVIKTVGSIILDNLRQNDMGVRYGGEEFLVYLEDTREEEAFEIAERLRQKIENCQFLFEACKEQITVSAGIADYEASRDHSPEACVRRADAALYHSKRNGRNRSTRASSMETTSSS
jgi:two-component system, cell cycle response regulator